MTCDFGMAGMCMIPGNRRSVGQFRPPWRLLFEGLQLLGPEREEVESYRLLDDLCAEIDVPNDGEDGKR